MKIYHYHPDTKEYLAEGQADLSPLDKEQGNDVWLIPAYATDIQPPPHIKRSDIVFIGGQWLYKGV